MLLELVAGSAIGFHIGLTTQCDALKDEQNIYMIKMGAKICGWIIGVGCLVASVEVLLMNLGVLSND